MTPVDVTSTSPPRRSPPARATPRPLLGIGESLGTGGHVGVLREHHDDRTQRARLGVATGHDDARPGEPRTGEHGDRTTGHVRGHDDEVVRLVLDADGGDVGREALGERGHRRQSPTPDRPGPARRIRSAVSRPVDVAASGIGCRTSPRPARRATAPRQPAHRAAGVAVRAVAGRDVPAADRGPRPRRPGPSTRGAARRPARDRAGLGRRGRAPVGAA